MKISASIVATYTAPNTRSRKYTESIRCIQFRGTLDELLVGFIANKFSRRINRPENEDPSNGVLKDEGAELTNSIGPTVY